MSWDSWEFFYSLLWVENFPPSLIIFFILFLHLIVFPRQFPICICDNFFSLCAVSLALLLFFYFLLHLILSHSFSLLFIFGIFCFSHFQWTFVWLSDLPWLVVAFVAYLYGEVFLENKRWKFQMLFAPKSFCYIFSFFSFCLVAYLGFELRLWLALKVLYELRISFNSLAGAVIATDRRRWRLRSVVYNFGFSSADFPFPFRAVVSFS